MIADRESCRKYSNGGSLMEKVYDRCCGVDIHKKLIVACFKQGRKQEIREYGASTRELLELAEWLAEGGCEQVAMESFIPDKARRELRELVGYRKSLLKEQTAEVNRLQKVLEGANIKLSGTVSEINGKSGRNFLETLLGGEKSTWQRSWRCAGIN